MSGDSMIANKIVKIKPLCNNTFKQYSNMTSRIRYTNKGIFE